MTVLRRVLSYLVYLLKTPSAFSADPNGFLRNQASHMAAFGFAPCVVFGWAALPAVVVLYTAVELVQFYLFDSERWDGAQDWGFVAMGAAFGLTLHPVVFMSAVAFLVSGYWQRLDAKLKAEAEHG